MTSAPHRTWRTPRELYGLPRIVNEAGMSVSALPTGAVFAIEHQSSDTATLIN